MTVATLPQRALRHRWYDRAVRGAGLSAAAIGTAAVMAYLLTAGLWPFAIMLLALLPVFVLVHRAPLSAVLIWLVLVPLVLEVPSLRPAYWLLHRALPLLMVGLLILTGMLGIRTGRLPRLGWPEAMMGGYLAISALSVIYSSKTASVSIIELYDRVAVPMILYLLIRLLRPSDAFYRSLVLAAGIVVVSQTVIGALSWVAPATLPPGWLTRAGSRTTGTLVSPSVYGVVLFGAGVILLHAASCERRLWLRRTYRILFLTALVMMVMTFTRGVWVAGIVGVAVVAVAHPHHVRRVALLAIPLVVALIMTGVVGSQVAKIETRFGSDETALSRLPVIYASIQMFEERPLLGFGYRNFDQFDREFQRPINGFFPDKDQASHNLYLTLLAEQGIVGFGLYLGPAIWWLVASKKSYARLPRSGFMSRKLLVSLWGVLAAHVVVNNFSNMGAVYGLGHWWMTLGLIAVLVSGAVEQPDANAVPVLEQSR